VRYIAFHERILRDQLNSLLAIALNNQDQSITLVLPNWKNYQLAIATDPAILWHESTGELTLPPFGGVILNGF
jgi:hypothetical protein